MTQQHVRVLYHFSRYSDADILEIAGAIVSKMAGNPAFPSPPIDLGAVDAARIAFAAAVSAASQGGTHATAEKTKQQRLLAGMLRRLAIYVQANCQEDPATALSSGFQIASSTRNRTPLPKPVIASVDNGHATQLLVTVDRVPKAKTYAVEVAPIALDGAAGPWQAMGSFTRSRAIPANGLTPGTSYRVRVRAVGGSTGYSDWSDPVIHMCM